MPTTTTPTTARAIAAPMRPPRIRLSAPGPQIIAEPTTGSTANTVVTSPQNTALDSPVNQNPMPTIVPWMAATRPVPITVEIVTSRNRSLSRSALAAENGI